MLEADKKRDIVSLLMNKGILLDRKALEQINTVSNIDDFHSFLVQNINQDQAIRSFSEIFERYETKPSVSADGSIVEKDTAPSQSGAVSVTFSYQAEPKKRDVQDFIGFFTSRYNALRNILQNRKELQNLTSINRINQKREREQSAIIGLVTNKQTTKTGKIILTVEDPTGQLKVIVSQNTNAFDIAKDTVFDEVIGVVGASADKAIFASNILLPDIPIYKELKKSPDEAYALFIGDFHFGSKLFLTEPFEKLLSWIRGEQGNEKQKEVSRKLKYIFLAGDLVEGVGIYPGQENDLAILDIYEQYSEFAKYLSKIPDHIQIIVCPGNHDAMRIAEPQPPLYKDFAEAVWRLPNVVMVSNPAYVNIHASKDFPGFEVLMYHGFSFIYYADNVESIRSQGGQKRSDLIMKFLLQRRHLAPSHKSTLYLPDAQKDSLVIDKIPDFFVSGHIHRTSAVNYRNITMINSSSWLEMTPYQEKVGLIPQPGRAVLVNLQTRQVKMLKFYDDLKEDDDKSA
jgi:DNA polymerase II small subunit